MTNKTLANNTTIPVLGLGTWKSASDDAYQAVLEALKAGYRHIDTAMIYGNEEAVGRAIRESGIPREDIFVTTKLWNTDQGYESTKEALQTSLKKLNMDYVDLYLIHWFKGYDKLMDTWKAMEELYGQGLTKAIGISNHNVHHIQYLLDHATVKPMVNQVETHVELQNDFLVSFCQEHNIVVEAYAPFMSWRVGELLAKEDLQTLAAKHNKTVPQVVLRWLLQRGIVPLPKSTNPKRIQANFDVFDFELDQTDMAAIAALNRGNKMFPEFDNITF